MNNRKDAVGFSVFTAIAFMIVGALIAVLASAAGAA